MVATVNQLSLVNRNYTERMIIKFGLLIILQVRLLKDIVFCLINEMSPNSLDHGLHPRIFAHESPSFSPFVPDGFAELPALFTTVLAAVLRSVQLYRSVVSSTNNR